VAAEGRLKVFWVATNAWASGDGIYKGSLTGVEGIPVTIEDFESAEKKIESMIENSITKKKTSTNEATPLLEEMASGIKALFGGSKEKAFTKKNTMTQNKSKGKKISVDYTLAFIKWIGDTHFPFAGPGDVGKYWAAAEYVLQAYMNGTVHELVETFFLQRNADRIEDVAVDTKLTEDNKDLVLTKYISLIRYPGVKDLQRRYSLAYADVIKLVYGEDKESEASLDYINTLYQKHMKQLKLLTKPNQTALKLYFKDPSLAFVKWIGDTAIRDDIKDPKDRYVVALWYVEQWKNEDDLNRMNKEREAFEAAIRSKDKSVQIITFVGVPMVNKLIMIFVGIAVVGTGFFVFKKRKQRKTKTLTDKTEVEK